MKKIMLMLMAVLFAAYVSGQSLVGFRPVYIVPDTSTKFTVSLKAGDLVWISSLKLMYQLEVPVGIGKTMTYILANTSRYTQSMGNTLGGYVPTFFVDTANAQNIYGIKTFYRPIATSRGGSATNSAFGAGSLLGITNGTQNTACGYLALSSTNTGSTNDAFGVSALLSNTSGGTNSAFGSAALYLNTSGSNNVAVGQSSLAKNTTSSNNTAVGYYSLWGNTTGAYNTSIGYQAGFGVKSGNGNVAIGKNAGPGGSTSTASDKLYISNVVGGADTALIYGDFSAKTLQFNGAVTLTSTITGASSNRGSSTFSSALTRKAVYIAGATSSDYYIVRGIATDQYTRPIAADLLNCFAKTDSLIVMRAAGTTANEGFTWFRIK